jgi:hypothetical protein
MEKISRIVPNSSRVTAVDMKKERPVRASAANFGQPVSQSTNRGPKKHAVDEATKKFRELYGPDAKLAKEADIAKRLSDDFFINQAAGTPVSDEVSASVEENFTSEIGEQPIIDTTKEESENDVMTKGPYSIRV